MSAIGLVGLLLLVGLGAIGLVFLVLEVQYRYRVGNRFEITPGTWDLDLDNPSHYQLVGSIDLINRTQRREIMVPELTADVTLLSKDSLAEVTTQVQVAPRHYDAPARPDGYWFAYIVKQKPTRAEITVDISGPDLSALQSAWVRVHAITYGPGGRVPKQRHIIVPLKFPAVEESQRWRPTPNADVLPIRTHLLTHLDSPVEVIKRYVLPHAQPGDVVTLGETPVALMQGRFRHPTEIRPGWVATRICYFFLPTSSLATACGMQSLVDIVGPWRVLGAFILGALAKKFLGKPGMFYQWAGEQARLIDDVTGTLPPYDQFIVLGPDQPQQVVDQIQQETGLAAAIVDVNDLKAVKILAVTPGVSSAFLEQALVTNPAGNADEQTPIVLIRPTT
ncbi:MAG: F420-0:Gamma-glutamyl ligase [Synechococcales cyanobacterium C42_A2020_086]|nr:F420-0:Gamma-glutamyl ligase [Synechococcales cyanobacterium M58_A2018_015]MBF2072689.1 F420-0:Gamma-glutamyl ligase [Synechococcales cyanobacterium C42_A2020_086]